MRAIAPTVGGRNADVNATIEFGRGQGDVLPVVAYISRLEKLAVSWHHNVRPIPRRSTSPPGHSGRDAARWRTGQEWPRRQPRIGPARGRAGRSDCVLDHGRKPSSKPDRGLGSRSRPKRSSEGRGFLLAKSVATGSRSSRIQASRAAIAIWCRATDQATSGEMNATKIVTTSDRTEIITGPPDETVVIWHEPGRRSRHFPRHASLSRARRPLPRRAASACRSASASASHRGDHLPCAGFPGVERVRNGKRETQRRSRLNRELLRRPHALWHPIWHRTAKDA
jgi:hypothetical protein